MLGMMQFMIGGCYLESKVVNQHGQIPLINSTIELQWLKHLWNYENMFEAGVDRATKC